MDKPWKVILAFVGVFMAGAIFGGLFTLRASAKRFAHDLEASRAAVPPPVAVKEAPAAANPAQATPATTKAAPTPQERNVMVVMRQLRERLGPTSEQQKAMKVIVARATDDLQRSQRDHWQEVGRVTDRMYEDLAGVLTPEQRVQLERMKQEMLERARNAKERQRLESQTKPIVRPTPTSSPAPVNRKSGPPEAANPGR